MLELCFAWSIAFGTLRERTQPQHNACRAIVTGLAKPLLTTWSCLIEAMYLALHRGGWAMQKQLGQLFLDQLLVIYEIQQIDIKVS